MWTTFPCSISVKYYIRKFAWFTNQILIWSIFKFSSYSRVNTRTVLYTSHSVNAVCKDVFSVCSEKHMNTSCGQNAASKQNVTKNVTNDCSLKGETIKRHRLWALDWFYPDPINPWIKIDQLDVICFIISLFNAQHVSNVSTSILRSLRLICWVISWVVLLWYDVCWCYVVVWLGWCGIRMQPETLLQPA